MNFEQYEKEQVNYEKKEIDTSFFSDVNEEVQRGKLGLNVGIPIKGLSRLSERIDNLQKRSYILISGDTGSGKTIMGSTISMDGLRSDTPCAVQFLSMELAPVPMKLRLITNHWYHKFNETVSSSVILSKGSKKINSEQEDKLHIVISELSEIFGDNVDLRCDMISNLRTFQKFQLDFYSKYGTFKEVKKNYRVYVPHNPDTYFITVLDNISNFTSRELINEISKEMVKFRNQTNGIYIVMQQYSASMEQSMTAAGKSSNMRTIKEPILTDLGDSKATPRDAELVLMMFYPARYGATSFRGWNTRENDPLSLGEQLRGIKIAKNRDGSDSGTLSLVVNGAANIVAELPETTRTKEYDENFYKQIRQGNLNQLL